MIEVNMVNLVHLIGVQKAENCEANNMYKNIFYMSIFNYFLSQINHINIAYSFVIHNNTNHEQFHLI